MESDLIINYQFTDITLIQCYQKYRNYKIENIQKIMDQQIFAKNTWMIRTDLQIQWSTVPNHAVPCQGLSRFTLQIYSNKDVIIHQFINMSGTVYSRDLQTLNIWCKQNGFNKPYPHKFLLEQNINLWKYYWQTFLINSQILDKKFGKR